jgi:hypothetical protein
VGNKTMSTDLKLGALFNRVSHQYITQIAAETAGFQGNDVQILVDHCNDPDGFDFLFDRYWKHLYDVPNMSGGAPKSCDIDYKMAVNENNLKKLSWASHYLEDCGCFFHTTINYQEYHLSYEQWVDDNINTIISMMNGITPYIIDDVEEAVKQLATTINGREQFIFSYFSTGDYENLLIETAENLKETINYLSGMYIKYIDDVNQSVIYEIPFQLDLTSIAFMFIAISLPFLLFMPEPRSIKP